MNTPRPFDKVYSIDVDGNIADLKTPILFEQQEDNGSRTLIEIPADEYDHNEIYVDKLNSGELRAFDNNFEKTYMHARDFHTNKKHRGTQWLQNDGLDAIIINKAYRGSFYRLLFDVLLEGRPFSINTARGHTPDNLKHLIYNIIMNTLSDQGMMYMIENIKKRYNLPSVLTDSSVLRIYLDNNMYYPGANIEIKKLLQIQHEQSSAIIKTLLQDNYITYIDKFIRQYQTLSPLSPVKMGFSDDGYENIKEMMKFFINKKIENIAPYNNFNYRLYYTGKNLEQVEDALKKELLDILWCDSQVIIEQKEYSFLAHKEEYYKKRIFVNDSVDIGQTFNNLKIMI